MAYKYQTLEDITKPNKIDLVDKSVLPAFFNAGGYVLDFNTEKFDQFTSQSVGIALCSYYNYKLSKGKSLESFTTYGETAKVVKLYDDLIRYYEVHFAEQLHADPAIGRQVEQLKQILNKYRGDGVSLASLPAIKEVTYDYIREISERAQKDIENGDLDSALTKSRTLLEEVFCHVIEKRGEETGKSGEIRNLYNQVKGLYHMHQDAETDRRINSLLSGLEKILTAIAEMRNGSSDAHGVGSRRINIKAHHARLFVNAAQTMADFILAVSEAAK